METRIVISERPAEGLRLVQVIQAGSLERVEVEKRARLSSGVVDWVVLDSPHASEAADDFIWDEIHNLVRELGGPLAAIRDLCEVVDRRFFDNLAKDAGQ